MKMSSFFLALMVFTNSCAFSQWTTPRPIDIVSAIAEYPLGIAIGPQRQIAVVAIKPEGVDTLVCYFSSDNGRHFSRTDIAHGWNGGFQGGFIGSVDGVGFDSHSNLFILWRMMEYDDAVGWYSFRISKSTNNGASFSLFWAASFLGGTTTSNLKRGALFIDSDDRVNCIWDSVLFARTYVYTRLSSNGSSVQRTVLPDVPVSSWPASVAVLAHENIVHAALSARKPSGNQNLTGLYYFQSTDAGVTFSSTVAIDTLSARNPSLIRFNNELLLIHAVGLQDYTDTALVLRRKVDSSFSEPRLLVSNLGSYLQPIIVRSRDSSLFAVYSHSDQTNYGVLYYEMSGANSTIIDSLFLQNHHAADLAIDSLGGKYLVSVYQNTLYLSTKDVLLNVPANDQETPENFHLGQNFPNPFNPSTTISYQIASRSQDTLKVFDVLGREVAVLANRIEEPGSRSVSWDASNVTSGVYVYQLRAGPLVETRKMLVIR